jgi:branched-chain amino acid transport system ATP-binding protein
MLQVEGVVKCFDAHGGQRGQARSERRLSRIGPTGRANDPVQSSPAISGATGKDLIQGEDIIFSPHDICRRNRAVFQIVNVFHRLTVFENVQVAVLSQQRKSNTLFRPASSLAVAETRRILESVGLLDKERRVVGSLSHGDQKILEIAIALGNEPELLILDEPTADIWRRPSPPSTSSCSWPAPAA